tara:strand:- start:666 stop:902 length:237 start_codon:yes stop_codon:yes gene_type:complete
MNPWLEHVKKVRAKNKNLTYKQVLQKAKTSYKKVGALKTKTKKKGKMMKKQGSSDRTNEKQGMEIKGMKDKMKKMKKY